MDRATYEANVYGAIFDALMAPPSRKCSNVEYSDLPYERELDDHSGCRWLVDYKFQTEDGNALVTVTKLSLGTDGPTIEVPLNAVSSRFLRDLEYEIAEEIQAELDDRWLSRED